MRASIPDARSQSRLFFRPCFCFCLNANRSAARAVFHPGPSGRGLQLLSRTRPQIAKVGSKAVGNCGGDIDAEEGPKADLIFLERAANGSLFSCDNRTPTLHRYPRRDLAFAHFSRAAAASLACPKVSILTCPRVLMRPQLRARQTSPNSVGSSHSR